jgi:hypothetical protein
MMWARNVARIGAKKNSKKILVGKHERKRQTPRIKCEDNIKMNLKEIRYEGADRIHLAQDRDH